MKNSLLFQPAQPAHQATDCFDTVFYGNEFTLATSNSTEKLTDNFQRKLTYLRLSITDFCNFRCNYCLPNGYQGKRPNNELTQQEIATLLAGFAALSTTKVRLTGGEPSIRHDLPDLIRLIKNTEGIKTACSSSNS